MDNKVFQRPVINESHPRNAFDLSNRELFTASPGMLLPFFCREVNPHDHLELGVQSFTRTIPVNVPAYVRLQESYDYFFVPYRLLWSYWPEWFTNVQDFNSTLLYNGSSITVPSTVPLYSMNSFIGRMVSADASGFGDSFGFLFSLSARRLMDLLGYGSDVYRTVTLDSDYSFNLFRVAAYQKIYFDIYRRSDFQVNNNRAYNLDSFSALSSAPWDEVFRLRYRSWSRDYFMNIYPSPLFSGNSVLGGTGQIPLGSWKLPVFAGNFSDGSGTVETSAADGFDTLMGVSTASGATSDYTFGVSTLRAAFALDKLQRASNYAEKHYIDQMKARFGISVNRAKSTECQFIGAFDNPLPIGEVVGTSDANLGALGGKGVGSLDSRKLTYDVGDEAGIVMGIYSVYPQSADYDANGLDAFNRKVNREDYFNPEFQDLGMQPLLYGEIDMSDSSKRNYVYGWQPRYSEYKSAVDKIHGTLRNGGTLPQWTMHRNTGISQTYANARDLFISPSCLDDLFPLGFNGTQERDIFINNVYNHCIIVRDMSVHGVPRI